MKELTILSDLFEATQQRRIDFLHTDMELLSTFVDLAKTEREIGSLDATNRLLEKAQAGYSTVLRLLTLVENAEERDKLASKFAELRAKLDSEAAQL